MAKYTLHVEPHTKPRMTRSDKWKKRPCVVNYRAYKDKLKEECSRVGLNKLEPKIESIIFQIPMPKSWKLNKMIEMCGKPHQQSPDLDNLCKGLWDAILEQDNYIYCVKNLEKYWSLTGSICIEQ